MFAAISIQYDVISNTEAAAEVSINALQIMNMNRWDALYALADHFA